jgi:hypothetical protein
VTAVLALTAWAVLAGILVRAALRRIETSMDQVWDDASGLFEDDEP